MSSRAVFLAAFLACMAGRAFSAVSFYDLEALDIDKKPFDFSSTKGQVVMVVNVATY